MNSNIEDIPILEPALYLDASDYANIPQNNSTKTIVISGQLSKIELED